MFVRFNMLVFIKMYKIIEIIRLFCSIVLYNYVVCMFLFEGIKDLLI